MIKYKSLVYHRTIENNIKKYVVQLHFHACKPMMNVPVEVGINARSATCTQTKQKEAAKKSKPRRNTNHNYTLSNKCSQNPLANKRSPDFSAVLNMVVKHHPVFPCLTLLLPCFHCWLAHSTGGLDGECIVFFFNIHCFSRFNLLVRCFCSFR